MTCRLNDLVPILMCDDTQLSNRRNRAMSTAQRNSVFTRRQLLASGLAAVSGSVLLPRSHAVTAAGADSNRICAFIKFIQSLSFEELATNIAAMGFDGIEATIRKDGLIEPEEAPDELPRLVESLRRHGLEITVMTTGVVRADDPVNQQLLRTAAKLGVQQYRMGYFRYDLRQSVTEQLEQFRPALRDLAALNRELGITAVYQNHAGAGYVGSTVWDLHLLLRDIPPSEVGIAFDIRHATAEAGISWPVLFNVARPHVQAVYVKDFVWEGRKTVNVPLGQGQVSPEFFPLLQQSGFSGPVSLHVEYLEDAGTEENLAALRTDLSNLRRLMTPKG